MPATDAVLVAPIDLATPAVALLYTSPVNGKGSKIDKASVCNHNGATQTVTFHIVPAGGAAGVTNLRVNAKSIADKATDLLPELVGRYLKPGDMIYGGASAANVNVDVTGRELT
jgi:hypothetical protein